jgi:hypothetical protein
MAGTTIHSRVKMAALKETRSMRKMPGRPITAYRVPARRGANRPEPTVTREPIPAAREYWSLGSIKAVAAE